MAESGPDYSPFYERLCAAFEAFNEKVDAIDVKLAEQNELLERQAVAAEASQKALEHYVARASSEEEGVYTRAVTTPNLHSLSRAVTMVSMKSTGRMSDIIAEMNSPSSLPHGE